jgi:hypothetical protein
MCRHHRHRCDHRCMNPRPEYPVMPIGAGMGCPNMMPPAQTYNMMGTCTMTPRGPVCQIMPRDRQM